MSRLVRAELRKLGSVPSTYVSLLAVTVLAVAVGVSSTSGVAHAWPTSSAADRAAFDAVGTSLTGFELGALGFGVFGVLVVSPEYGTGLILATLSATPRRLRVFTAKVLCLVGLAVAVAAGLVLGTFLLGQRLLAGTHRGVGLGDAGVARTLATAVLYLVTVAVLGLGLGSLVRHTAGALGLLFAVVFLAYGAARALEGWSYLPDRLLLANAADALGQVHPVASPRTPSLGLAAADLAGYVAVSLGLGLWRFRRDPL